MLVGVDRLGLLLGRLAPQQEHHVAALLVDHLDHVVSEPLPPALRMRVGLTVLNC